MPRTPAGTSWRTIALLGTAIGMVAAVQLLPDRRFVTEATEHLVLGMLVPLVVVVARPAELLGAAFGPRRLHRWSRTPWARVGTTPLLVAIAFVLTPWLLWLTPLRELVERSGPAHLVVHLHLFVVGVLFVEHLAGRAPLPARFTPPMRLLVGAVILVAHGFLGLVLSTLDRPLFDTGLSPGAALADQRSGAQVMWVGGELLMVALLAATMWDWMRREERSTPGRSSQIY